MNKKRVIAKPQIPTIKTTNIPIGPKSSSSTVSLPIVFFENLFFVLSPGRYKSLLGVLVAEGEEMKTAPALDLYSDGPGVNIYRLNVMVE